MTITHLTSTAQLDEHLRAAGENLSVIDFHATWCGPCHAIAPVYESLAKDYPSVKFFKCDVDQAQDVAQRYTISAMPTFVFLKGETKIDLLRGANPGALKGALRRHAGEAGSSKIFSGKGETLSGGSANSVPGQETVNPQVKMLGLLLVGYLCFWYFSK